MKKNDILEYSYLLKAISNPKRLKILAYINEKELNVTELQKKISLSQSALSQHLAVLRKAKIVTTRRNAQTIYYILDNKLVKEILKLLKL